MKRYFAAALSILAVAAGVGWKLGSQPETSAGLQQIRLDQKSERSNPGPDALAGIRIRLNGSDFQNRTDHKVPQIALAE
jgi:hypothetical protein